MPVLSFPCIVVARDHTQQKTPFREFQIKGFDLRELALAATNLLKASPDECGYTLYTANAVNSLEARQRAVGRAASATTVANRATNAVATAAATMKQPRVYLEVVRAHPHASAIVGPMDGPTPPSILSPERCYSIEELIAHTQVADGPDAEGAYAVIVKHTGIFDGAAAYPPPHRRKGESDAEYVLRAAPMARARRERAQYEGFHVVHYDVPPDLWRAGDLDLLMALLYRLLPTHEPQWRETGAVTQETFAGGRPGGEPAYQYCLQVARGEYIAHLRLPHFPTCALADWLRTRKCDINLCHPVASVRALTRTVAQSARPRGSAASSASPTTIRDAQPESKSAWSEPTHVIATSTRVGKPVCQQ
jgi:hypothetical protein